jgi:hypothetical protein
MKKTVHNVIRHAREAQTAVIVGQDGTILAIVDLPELPGLEAIRALTRPFGKCALSIYPRGEYTADFVEKRLRSAVEGIELSEQGLLKPGANCL